MKELWQYWTSKNRKLYKEIALELQITPWRVYKLAHGSRARTRKECEVLEELRRQGIVSKIYPW